MTEPLRRVLRIRDGLAVTVGIVIGAGILRTPGLIAGYLGNGWLILAGWWESGETGSTGLGVARQHSCAEAKNLVPFGFPSRSLTSV